MFSCELNTAKVYNRIIIKLKELIKSKNTRFPEGLRLDMQKHDLWEKWRSFIAVVDRGNQDISVSRDLALPKFIEHCHKHSIDRHSVHKV